MGVTRFPNGVSFVKPNMASAFSGVYYITPGDQTPDVAQGSYFVAHGSAFTILNFDNGQEGQILNIRANTGGAITLQNSAGGINLTNFVFTLSASIVKVSANTGDVVMLNNEIVQLIHNGTDWSQVGTRFVDTNA